MLLGPKFEEKDHPSWKLYWNEDGTQYDSYMNEEAAAIAAKTRTN